MGDTQVTSWIPVSPESNFPIQNLPYGVFSRSGEKMRVGVAIGDFVLDLARLHEEGLFPETMFRANVFAQPFLNDFLRLGKPAWSLARVILTDLLQENCPHLRDNTTLRESALIPQSDVQLHLPLQVPNLVDFYSSEQHAKNAGKLLRPDAPLYQNWRHLPVGYNGRASSIVVSETNIQRPSGQLGPRQFGPTQELDFELELGFIIGKENKLGEPIFTAQAEDYVFGFVLVNDWSARDIQRWEYQPLGPFLGKSFASSISPWVVPLEALQPFRVPGPKQVPPVLPYLQCDAAWSLDLQLEVSLRSQRMTNPQTICRVNAKELYWNAAQQLAHLTSVGTRVQVGDLCASGTISGDTPDSLGCLLEITAGGRHPFTLHETAETRRYLEDGDTAIMSGSCAAKDFRVGFGQVAGKIIPASAR